MKRASSLLSAVLLLGGFAVVLSGPASAVEPVTTTASPDYASEVHADPWDFSNAEDLLLDRGPTMALEDARIEAGLLQFSLREPGYVSPVWGGYPGGLYLGREAGNPALRIDADRYRRFSMHAWSSRDVEAGLMWWSCEGLDRSCMGGRPFALRAGWNTYDITLSSDGYGLPQEWLGTMTGFRLAVTPDALTSVAVDWMRLYAPEPSVTVPQGSGWDVDRDPTGTGLRPGAGEVPCAAEPCDLSFLPAGTYWTVEDGTRTGPVVLRRRARPVVLDPDAVGGEDYAAADPWDGSAVTDLAGAGNVTDVTYGDRLTAVNAPPVINDPHLWLALRTPSIDSDRFHRLTVRSGYDGPFRLEDDEGGGSMARLVWDHGGGHVQQTEDIVTYGGTRTVTVDLNAPGVHETDINPDHSQPWSTGPVTRVRWDPNEDRGARRFWLDRLAIRADDEAGTSYDVRWFDAGHAPGATVTVLRAEDATGTGAQEIATGIEQHAGTNVFRWETAGAPLGEHWIGIRVSGPAGEATSWSSGPVQLVGPSLRGQAPSPATPLSRDLADACPQDRVPEDGYTDVAGVHEASVDCLAWWGLTRPVGGFAPDDQVTRGQMATFLRRLVEQTSGPLPAGGEAFPDDAGAHEESIEALAAARVVNGYSDGTFRPAEPVTRAQMATFLVRAAELAGDRSLPAAADYFADDDGSTHEASIDKAAAAGLAGGVAEGRYAPHATVRRGQMASFLVRTLDVLVSDGHGAPPA